MSIGVGKPSSGAVYVSPKGLEKLQNAGNWGKAQLEMIKEVAQNQNEATNDFIVDDYGNFNIRNEKYGTFTTNNPPCPEVVGKTFCINIRRKGENNFSILDLDMKDNVSAKELKEKFGPGTSVPGGVVALYNAMNAADAYKKAEEARVTAENTKLANEILGMTNPYTGE